jgi:hypothetical protein
MMSIEHTNPSSSENAPTPPTFANLIAGTGERIDITQKRRRELTSSLRCFARRLGLPVETVPCDVEWLNERLAPLGRSARSDRWTNVLSDVRAVLRHHGVHEPHRKGEDMLASEWRSFLSRVEQAGARGALRNLARWHNDRGLGPELAESHSFADFLAFDRRTRLSAATMDQGSALARAWRDAVAVQPCPGNFKLLDAPKRRKPYTLRFKAYPLSFQQDVSRFEVRLSGGPGAGPFSGTKGPRRRLREATIKARLFAIQQAAAALVLTGTPTEAITSLRDLVSPMSNVGTILDFYDARADGRTGSQLAQIAETLRQIGCFHVDDLPEADRLQLSQWARDASGERRKGISGKARKRLLQLIADRPRAMLLHLPAELVRRAKAGLVRAAEAGAAADTAASDAARMVRTALMIEIVTICPLRLTNLQMLRLDGQLAYLGSDRRLPSHILIDAEDTKNSEPVQWPLPRGTAILIRDFVERHRTQLPGSDSPYLFAGEKGEALSKSACRYAITGTIKREIGIDVHPHLLRHFAAWLYLTEHPGQYEMVRRVLGHKSVQTTIDNYVGLETGAAAAAFDETVLRERARTKHLAAAAFARPAARARKGGR